jgi:hexosaminidase
VTYREGRLERPGAPHGPAEIVALAHEVMGDAATGDYALVDDASLGDEGYHLEIDDQGVRATARTLDGLRWAVQTVRQLSPDLPFVEITDVPRYAWRGTLLDVARWCHPIGWIHRFVDLLAMHKINRLHLHLTDDQGWRFEVRKYPLLTAVGGFRSESMAGLWSDNRYDGTPHGGFYTQAELRELVAYASRRGVRIMPEIDLPGHMVAAITAYPHLGNDPSARLEVRTAWGISDHILNCEPATVAFMTDVMDELCEVFDFEMIHLGGDEVPPTEWLASESAKAVAAANGLPSVEHLSGWWIRTLARHLATRGRRVAGWDEIVDAGAPAGTTIFSWRGVDRIAAGRDAGHQVVAAPEEYTYFDWAESDDPAEPLAIPNGLVPLAKAYSFDPGDVLGPQAQLWSEYIPTPEAVEWRAFPRIAALAEVAWSGPGRDFTDFRSRLVGHLPRLDALGVNYRPLS